MYHRNTHKRVCTPWEGRRGQCQLWISFLQLKMKNQICLIPQKDYLRRNPSGFIFNQITIAKSFLNCIIPNHTIIRAKIQASVWHNCSFWLLLMILKVSTTDALVLSEILLKTQEGPRHLFSGVLFLLLKTRCLKWEQKCNYMDRCYWVQNSLH